MDLKSVLRSSILGSVTATLEQTRSDLENELAPRLIAAIRRAVRIFLDKHGAHAADYSSRSIASLVHDYMVIEVSREFVGEPRAIVRRSRGLVTVTMLDRYVFKLKRLDRNFRTRNIPTQTTLRFLAQEPLPFPELPATATNLSAGYQPGHILSESTFWIVCQEGSALSWLWDFHQSPEQPTPITRPDTRTGRVVRKPAAAEQTGTAEG
jgi:hypothetical protein